MLSFMNAFIKTIQSDKTVFLSLVFAVLLTLLHLSYLAFSYASLPPLLPLFHQMPWGEGRLGAKPQIVFPVTLAVVTIALNALLAGRLYERLPLLARILALTTLLVSVLGFLFSVRTVLLIT